MSVQSRNFLTINSPQLDRAISTPGGDRCPILGYCHTPNCIGMTCKSGRCFTRFQIPKLGGFVGTGVGFLIGVGYTLATEDS